MSSDISYIGKQTEETVNERYHQALKTYDEGALLRKRFHVVLTVLVHLMPYLALVLAIVGIVLPTWEGYERIILWGFLPAFATLSLLGTLVRYMVNLRGKWLLYRAAVGRLWKQCMLYRARLPPYDGANALDRFNDELDLLKEEIDVGLPKNPYDRSHLRYYLHLVVLPRNLQPELDHLPGKDIYPPLVDVDQHKVVAEDSYLKGRIRSQQRWHLRKARRYCLWYCILQGLIGLVVFANMLYVYFNGRAFWLTAGSTVLTLTLFAVLQLLDYGRLFPTYIKVAGNLGDIEEDYHEKKKPFNDPSDLKRFQTLVKTVEDLLDLEFERWLASRP